MQQEQAQSSFMLMETSFLILKLFCNTQIGNWFMVVKNPGEQKAGVSRNAHP